MVFKQAPVLPLVPALRVTEEEELAEISPNACHQLVGVWDDLYREVQRRQKAYDAKMLS